MMNIEFASAAHCATVCRWKLYPAYKDSGVEWLGEVPEHWENIRLKMLVNLINQKAGSEDLRYIGLENIESLTGNIIETDVTPEGTANIFKSNDVLFGKLRPYLSKVLIPDFEGRCTSELLVLRPKKITRHFLFYYCISDQFIEIVNSSTYGAKMPRANWDFIGNMVISCPPDNEQHAINSFLDRETARLDILISKKKRLISLLKEKRAALISHTVTKGLNPDVPMKDSGVEWLGKIPVEWDSIVLKRAFDVKLGKMLQSAPASSEDTLELYLRAANILWSGIDLSDVKQMWFSPYEISQLNLEVDDLLVSEGGDVGRTAIWKGEIEKCYIQNAINRVRSKEKHSTHFLYYWLCMLKNIAYIDMLCNKYL